MGLATVHGVVFKFLVWARGRTAFLTQKGPPQWAALSYHALWSCLLSGLLLRRVERAGLVDIGDLVVAEAEHRAQDLVGVLAEQGRARDVARGYPTA